jgi:ribose transport system permease protein
MLAALAGVIAASDTGVAQADVGIGTELTAIAAVIIGGTSVAGGRGSVWRTLAGVMLLSVVANGFTLLYVSPTYDQLVQGAIILLAIVTESMLSKRAAP